MSDSLRVGIVGASGYGGGELLRLLVDHPHADVQLATSSRYAGKQVRFVHPNLRGVDLRFEPHEAAEAQDLDVLFVAGPHGTTAPRIQHYLKGARRVVDLSADFRLADPAGYERWYSGWAHPAPELLGERAYGIAELHRNEIRDARLVAGAGCVATTSILALHPLAQAGVLEPRVVVDAKVGSSAAGASPSLATHHPERAGCLRSYAPTGHRHEAEVRQETGLEAHLSCTAVENVRGILVTAHGWLREDLSEKDVWRIYREAYGEEPFVRLVKERQGIYRFPEPKILAGTNFCDVGFEVGPEGRIVALAALDNLMKGTAGAAVQNMNIQHGFPETTGLEFRGLHP